MTKEHLEAGSQEGRIADRKAARNVGGEVKFI